MKQIWAQSIMSNLLNLLNLLTKNSVLDEVHLSKCLYGLPSRANATPTIAAKSCTSQKRWTICVSDQPSNSK